MTIPRFLLTTCFTTVCLIAGARYTWAQDTTAVGSISGVVTSGDGRHRGLNTVEVNKRLGIFPVLGLEWRF